MKYVLLLLLATSAFIWAGPSEISSSVLTTESEIIRYERHQIVRLGLVGSGALPPEIKKTISGLGLSGTRRPRSANWTFLALMAVNAR